MSSQYRVARWATIALSCILLVSSGLVIVGVAPSFYAAHGSQAENEELMALGSTTHFPGFGPPKSVSVEMPPLPPESHMRNAIDAQFARYDNIMVDVKRDGTLHVLGERMALKRFKSLLGTQMREQAQTVVTIRADDNCPFRYVGSVISACNEAGVMYLTKPQPAAVSIEMKPGGPA